MPNYLFNGVELPALPDWDKETYPHVIIMQECSSATYFAQAVTVPLYTETAESIVGKSIFRLVYTGGKVLRTAVDDTGKWESWAEWPSAYFSGRLEYNGQTENVLVWTNTDILNSDGKTVYLPASDPVPVSPVQINPAAFMQGFMVGQALRRNRT